MNPALAFHETILARTVIAPTDWRGGARTANFLPADSMHSFLHLRSCLPRQRHACWCDGDVAATFTLSLPAAPARVRQRHLLKFTAAWRDWRKHAHPAVIAVNDTPVYDAPLFLENVATGWPSQYFPIPPGCLRDGSNEIRMRHAAGADNLLLVASAEILRLPDERDFSVYFAPTLVRVGETFRVILHLHAPRPEIAVAPADGISFLGRAGDNAFLFRADRPATAATIAFAVGPDRCAAVIDEILPPASPGARRFLVGADTDDLRTDTSGEQERVLEHFIRTETGNLWVYVTGEPSGRTSCPALRPSPDRYAAWLRTCRDNGIWVQHSGRPVMIAPERFAAEAGERFAGFHFHEPYLVFQPFQTQTAPEALRQARTPAARKAAYVDYLEGRVRHLRVGDSPVFAGEPSLTCVYNDETSGSGIICEPVSNTGLLYGAIRAGGRPFGACIPGDWYFGAHDERAVRRILLALALNYAYGGEIVSIQSCVFKTNCFSRNDWEDPFCRQVRAGLRAFHLFSRRDERLGRPVVPLALMYGHLESMFWMNDDRIPEAAYAEDWDETVWGLDRDVGYRRVWEAADAWLPRVPADDTGRDEYLTRMFTGTPYGAVDVVTPHLDLAPYRAVAFLGWNTMTAALYDKLLAYVQQGGTLFICGCHCDTRESLLAPVSLHAGGRLRALIGADIAGPGREVARGVRACAIERPEARRLGDHFWLHAVGRGRVYFGNFYDYPADAGLIAAIAALLRTIGAAVRDAEEVVVHAESPYVNVNVWADGDRRKLYAIHADWRADAPVEVVATYRGREQHLHVGASLVTAEI